MPLSFLETTRFKLKALTGKNPVHEIGTGFAELAKQLDEVIAEVQDYIQAGVVGQASWTFVPVINGTTGAVTAESGEIPGGVAWLPEASGNKLRRTVSSRIANPSSGGGHPKTEGKYSVQLWQIGTPSEGWNDEAKLAIVNSAEFSTLAEAEAHIPVPTTGNIGIYYLIIKYEGGKYKIEAQKDLRPWAGLTVRAGGPNILYIKKSYTKAEMETGIELSSERPAIIVGATSAITKIGGVNTTGSPTSGVLVPPGQKIVNSAATEMLTLVL